MEQRFGDREGVEDIREIIGEILGDGYELENAWIHGKREDAAGKMERKSSKKDMENEEILKENAEILKEEREAR